MSPAAKKKRAMRKGFAKHVAKVKAYMAEHPHLDYLAAQQALKNPKALPLINKLVGKKKKKTLDETLKVIGRTSPEPEWKSTPTGSEEIGFIKAIKLQIVCLSTKSKMDIIFDILQDLRVEESED